MTKQQMAQSIHLQYPCTNLFRLLSPLTGKIRIGGEAVSTWLVSPYFLLYFIIYIMNSLVWPLQFMERACKFAFPEDQDNVTKFNATKVERGPVLESCIEQYLVNKNRSDTNIVNMINTATLNIMIVSAFGGGCLAILSYFLIWKPLFTNCRTLAFFLPPMCIICQTLLLEYSQGVGDFSSYKYAVLASVLLPSLHCNFQGVLLLMFHISEVPVTRGVKLKFVNMRLEGSHMVIMTSILFAGSFLAAFFNLDYSYMFFTQITLGCVCTIYALTMIPVRCACLTNDNDDDDEEEMDEEEGQTVKGYIEEKVSDKNSLCSIDSLHSEEDILEDIVKNRSNVPISREIKKLLKDVPMNFAETSRKKKWIVIIEICVFTVALVSDTSIIGPYLVDSPISIDALGYLLVLQGIMKIFGMIFVKFAVYFFQLKHGSLICLSAINYIGYFIALAFATTKDTIIAVMFSNFVGGIAFPTLYSFIKLNLKETADATLELAVISSLLVTMGFNALEYFVYGQTRDVFPGAIFLLTALVIVISIIVIWTTYLTSTMRTKRRRTRYITDMLLNDMQ